MLNFFLKTAGWISSKKTPTSGAAPLESEPARNDAATTQKESTPSEPLIKKSALKIESASAVHKIQKQAPTGKSTKVWNPKVLAAIEAEFDQDDQEREEATSSEQDRLNPSESGGTKEAKYTLAKSSNLSSKKAVEKAQDTLPKPKVSQIPLPSFPQLADVDSANPEAHNQPGSPQGQLGMRKGGKVWKQPNQPLRKASDGISKAHRLWDNKLKQRLAQRGFKEKAKELKEAKEQEKQVCATWYKGERGRE